MSWYKEMAGRICEMCHRTMGQYLIAVQAELKSWTINTATLFVCASCQWFLNPLPCYRFTSPPAKLNKRRFAARFYNAAFLALWMSCLILSKIILSFLWKLHRA